ncbi:MAG: ATP-binding protein [Chitinophagales bacterium]
MTPSKHTLFQKITTALKQCDLSKALELGELALENAKAVENHEELAQAYILMVKISQRKGLYSGNHVQIEKALEYANKAYELIPYLDSPFAQADIYNSMAHAYLNNQDISKAYDFVEKSLKLCEENDYTKGKYNAYMIFVGLYGLQNNFSTALDYAFECYHYSNENDDKVLLMRSLHSISSLYIATLQYHDIFEYAKQLLVLAQSLQDKETEMVALINLSVAYGSTGDYKNCMTHLMDALKKSEAIQYRSNIAKCHGNIGTLYTLLSNNEEALKHYEIVYNNYIDAIDKRDETALLINLGDLYFGRGELELADTYYTLCLELSTRINFNERIATSLVNKSQLYNSKGNHDEAYALALQAQQYFDKMSHETADYHAHLINLAEIFLAKQDFEKCIKYGEEGQKLCLSRKDKHHLSQVFDVLSNAYAELKSFETALAFRNKYVELKQELLDEQKYYQIIDMQIAYETEKKEIEIEILTKENQYQALLLEKRKKIEVQNELLKQANQELQQFTYAASHDLKEPLRMIGSYTTLLEHRLKSHLDDSTKEFMGFISSGVNRMNKLLEDLLKYATLLNNNQQEDLVDLNSVVQDVLDNFQLKIQDTNAHIEVVQLPIIKGYYSQLLQLFQNLISNAIKFKKDNVSPHIIISVQEDVRQYIIKVADNGIGIPEEFQKKVFDIFYRLHRQQDYEGTGIGLALCQKIAIKHGGIIWMESEENKGTHFYISFPKT